jgi:hypothetical protein
VSAGYCEFEFDLPGALLTSMVKTLDGMESAPLTHLALQSIPEGQGVYQLLLRGGVVYIGKTDSEAGLQKRLSRHAWSIQNRSNLNVADVSFKAVRVFVFTAIDLETQLIRHYAISATESWNNSGFGSNDPGRNRDATRVAPTSFDARYPIDLDQPLELGISGVVSAASAVAALRRALPYTLRAEGGPIVGPDLLNSSVTLPEGQTSCRETLRRIVSALPRGWQATALAGRFILYKEFRDDYPAGRVIARS